MSRDMLSSRRLIDEVKKHRVLYDKTQGNYSDYQAKMDIWKEIAIKLYGSSDSGTVERTRMKWKTIRDSYTKGMVVYNKRGSNNRFAKPPRFWKELDFLRKHVRKTNKGDSIVIVNNLDDSNDNSHDSEVTSQDDKSTVIDKDKLIEMVEKHPILYNKNMENYYKGNALRKKIWSEISMELCGKNDDFTVAQLKTKWKILKDSYVRSTRLYLKRKSVGMTTNSEADYYKRLSFLSNVYDLENEDLLFGNSECEVELHEMEDKFNLNGDFNSFLMIKQEENGVNELDFGNQFQTLGQRQNMHPVRDVSEEIESFFSSIAKTVQRLKPINQALIKKTVANIVMDIEIKEARES